MPVYRMHNPVPKDPHARDWTNEEPFEASSLTEALEYSCRGVQLNPETFGATPGQSAYVTVEEMHTGRTLSVPVRYRSDEPSI